MLISNVMLSLVAMISLVAIYITVNSLKRPFFIFIILSIIPGIILWQFYLLPKSATLPKTLITQLIILTITLVVTGTTVFPYNGGDTWAHLHDATVIANNQSLQAVTGAYHDYPLYPAYLAAISTLTGFPLDIVARFMNVYVLCSIIFLLLAAARQLKFSPYRSLMLVMLLLGSKWLIYWSMLVVSMTTGILFYSLLLVLLLSRLQGDVGKKDALIIIITIGILPFFHPVIATAIIILLGSMWFLDLFIRHKSIRMPSLLGMVVLAVVLTLSQWMYWGDFVFERTVISLVDAIFRDGESSLQLATSARDPFVYTVDLITFYFLIALAGLEVLRQVRNRRFLLNFYSGVLGLIFLGFGYGTQVINLQAVLPHRWLLFGTFLLVFPASTAFAQLFKMQSKIKWGLGVVFIMLYFFVGLVNSEANRDRPLYGEAVTQQFELTNAEFAGVKALETVAENQQTLVRVDFRLWDYLKYRSLGDNVGYWQRINPDGFDGVFVLRDAYRSRLILENVIDGDDDFQGLNVSRFYDSGSLQLLDHPKNP